MSMPLDSLQLIADEAIRTWPVVPLADAEQVPEVLSAVRAAYESVG